MSFAGALVLAAALQSSLFPQAFAEEVTFIVPGSEDPRSVTRFDPPIQIIDRGQTIVFVNPSTSDHRLVVKSSSDGKQEFDTGVMKQNQFVSHEFPAYGEYSVECTIYPHMKSDIRVTDDIATFTKSIPEQNLDVQLSRSPANPGVGQETFFKVIFVDKNTGKNRSHVDFTLTFDDSLGNYVDGMGGHTVDGAEYGSFTFDREESFTPKVEISGLDFVPISPVVVEFNSIVTPEFPLVAAGSLAAVIGAVALIGRLKLR